TSAKRPRAGSVAVVIARAPVVRYFARQCFMQISYSVPQAAREWFFTQARCVSLHILQSAAFCARAVNAAPQPNRTTRIAMVRATPSPPRRRIGWANARPPSLSRLLSSLRCGLVEGRAQAARELERVVIGPEVHEV